MMEVWFLTLSVLSMLVDIEQGSKARCLPYIPRKDKES